MKVKKVILILVFLSACMPQSANTITPPTETTAPVETSAPSALPTETPILPEKDVLSYKFKPLNEEEYQYIFGAIGYEIDDQRFDVYYRDIPNYLLALQSEYLLKFPETENQEDIKWSIAIRSATEDYSKTHIGDGLIEEYLLEIFSRNLS
ncbi:MAG TPA: hypothetical protein DIW23_00945, partial [Anaerolineae bacterium]|nr:hypothetical protein [Anaerolineae bacterium]